jgi:hypothetical protein
MMVVMVTITVTVPDELKRGMRKFRHINWSSVARRAFEQAIHEEEKREAARQIDRLRSVSRTPGWSGAKEIRRWRDRFS